jgi:hypothetical protein
MRWLTTLVLVSPFFLSHHTATAQCTATSGDKRAAFVELYTSEGCDSCPPADRWLSTLKSRADVVPLAFHVDYWDYIGWKDKYAQAAFGTRHRERVQAQNSRSVYTPQVMVNGQDSLAWRTPSTMQSLLAASSAATAPLAVQLSAKPTNNGLQVSAKAEGANLRYTFALFQNGVVSNVTAGENKGVRLQQDYVVRAYRQSAEPSAQLTLPADVSRENAGVAVIVESAKGEYLQAVALTLAKCS